MKTVEKYENHTLQFTVGLNSRHTNGSDTPVSPHDFSIYADKTIRYQIVTSVFKVADVTS